MLTFLGEVNCNFHNGDLTIDGYVFNLYRGYHKRELEIRLKEDEEYFIIEEVEKNGPFRDPVVYIVNSRGSKLIRIASFQEGNDFELLDREKIESLKEHFYELNKNTTKAINRRKKNFLNNVTEKTMKYKPGSTVRTMIYNFIAIYPPVHIYKNTYNLEIFEEILLDSVKIGNDLDRQFKSENSWYGPNSEYKERLRNELKPYYSDFLKLAEVIKRREKFDDDVTLYFTWLLFNEEVCHYYHDQFHEQYGFYFPNVEILTCDECINHYVKIENFDIESTDKICMFTFYLMYLNKFQESDNYLFCYRFVRRRIADIIRKNEMDEFESWLLNPAIKDVDQVTIDDIDLMGGHDFEVFVDKLFENMGYQTSQTKATGDQGIDIIAEKNGRKYGIQTKCYSGKVSNSAIQEVVAGLRYYKLDRGIVVTNNYFTESARELAQSNGVILWDKQCSRIK